MPVIGSSCLIGDPKVAFRVGKQEFSEIGRVVDESGDNELRRRVSERFNQKYEGNGGSSLDHLYSKTIRQVVPPSSV